MPEYERHGTLMVDECKITPSKHFDKNRLEVLGFVDLGDYTPISQRDQLGDHVLVIMFQSFAGKNMQAVGCFLSKGNVCGSTQAKLILEAIVLCEAAGLFIDVVTSDGATWNRSMWKHLGAGNPQAPWVIHPCNDVRKLRMCSDFPHLLKCLRNRLVAKKEFHVPTGHVQLVHFQRLIEYDAQFEFKLAPKLTLKHVDPQNHEKMTTRYAFQLFSGTVADALSMLNSKNIPGFLDCQATIEFCRRINKLSDILNSSNGFSALRLQSPQYEELEDFLIYLDLWESCADQEHFLTKNTADGLRATINTTLDLLKYCTETLNFNYLMTSRINQDPLEHFFGLLRDCGGSNNCAESVQIAQIFRLMSLYSLVKPPKGSNVTGGNMLEVLVNDKQNILNCISSESLSNTKQEIDLQLDRILDEDISAGREINFKDNEEAFAYVCGFLARKYKSEACQDCKNTIIGNGVENFNTFIALKSRGHLIFPSSELLTLLEQVEAVIGGTLKSDVKRNALLDVLHELEKRKINHFIGCMQHKFSLTKRVIFSFLILRMSFACKKESRKRSVDNRTSKKYAKLAKLV
ncbi:hypothetical protein Zmor_014679 [Zophobas morio]|uniref:Transposable element P transposase n=1 Tax=Zophobas morio TaxID=2755281 RepID=A0AA38IK72_9CUCU|nr:hypothetical protein Zmor_014679 [Zophobas morio]